MTATSKKLTERAEKTRKAAHERVVKRGILHFRLDQETMEKLLRLADQRKTGAGVLARMWVVERLEQELNHGVSPLRYDIETRLKALEAWVREQPDNPSDNRTMKKPASAKLRKSQREK